MTTRVAGFCISIPSMYVNDQLTWDQFEQKFGEAFGRDMTSDQRRWFYSIWEIVSTNNDEKAKAAAA